MGKKAYRCYKQHKKINKVENDKYQQAHIYWAVTSNDHEVILTLFLLDILHKGNYFEVCTTSFCDDPFLVQYTFMYMITLYSQFHTSH